MGLLDAIRPKWKNSDADVRKAAALELEDPAILVSIIVDDTEWFVRHDVFAHLRSLAPEQKWYMQLMRESGDEEVRRKVAKVMTEISDLEWVVQNDQYRYVRDAAEHRLSELKEDTWGESGDAAPAQ